MSTTLPGHVDLARKLRFFGMPFQFMFLASFSYQTHYHFAFGEFDLPAPVRGIGLIGLVLVGWAGLKIYWPRKEASLITSGVFKFTRHPMYTGFAFIAVFNWWPIEEYYPVGWVVSLLLFWIGLLVAAYIQEKETLARFGAEAEQYYRRTPRLFLFWPYCPFFRD